MAPDPAVDQDAPTNYLFSGGANNAVEGDPIPILYGELRVPGRAYIYRYTSRRKRFGMWKFDQDIINNTVTDSANNV